MSVTRADGICTTAIALASWSATYALFPTTEMYSGSRLRETGLSVPCGVGPNTRTPAGSLPFSNAWKSAVDTSFCFEAMTFGLERRTMETEPSGSTVKSSDGSPSFAVNANRPSGVMTTLSGWAPTVTEPSTVGLSARASKKTRVAGDGLRRRLEGGDAEPVVADRDRVRNAVRGDVVLLRDRTGLGEVQHLDRARLRADHEQPILEVGDDLGGRLVEDAGVVAADSGE
jgi:hypothetical protein